ncbi:MAG: hypothetical protein AAF741_09325 [Bacteroidota bacterium]
MRLFVPVQIPPNHWALYDTARRYDEAGDLYHAVKLYKRVAKLVPDWAEPHRSLGQIYSTRKEWKPAYHYWQKSIGLDAEDREAWWQLGIAATGLRKMGIAKAVWNKFGLDKIDLKKPLGLRIQHQDGFEVLWMQCLDPGRARILSIPHPSSSLRYRHLMLYDRRDVVGTHVVSKRRVPIFAGLAPLKASPFKTHSCLLHTGEEKMIARLELLCHEAGIGFEVWSNANRTMTPENAAAFPEYYSDLLPKKNTETALIALAAIHPAEIERVLNDWQIITLGSYSDLRAYH